MQNLRIRKSGDRGYARHGWLESYHSFSFAHYHDPLHMNFSVLRVINDDVIAPGRGFGMHPHHDMEIITYMLQGELRHQDSLGNGSVIRAGDVQRMTAGTGIVHSEMNASSAEHAHLLQIWVLPERLDLQPGYEEKHFGPEQKLNRWCLIAARDSHENVLKIHQNMQLYATMLDPEARLGYVLDAKRSVYLHVAKGQVEVNGHMLMSGDALMLNGAAELVVTAVTPSELLLFDLPLH